jgi:putative oxidoreductase
MSTRTGTETDKPVAGASSGADAAILFLRVIIGVLMIGHGTGKLFGWFNQSGLKGTEGFFKSIGYEPAHAFAIADGIGEVVVGVLLIFGFLVPLAAAYLIGELANAAWVKSPKGFWIANDGYEYEVVLMILVIGITIAGAGAYALDRNRNWFGNRVVGVVVAVVLGLIGAGVLAIIRK